MSRGDELYFGNLPHDIRETEIEDFFKGYGRIRDIKVKKGFSFVQFNDPRDAEDAKRDLDRKRFCGAQVTVDFAKGGGRDGRSGRPRDDEDRRGGDDRRGGSGFGGFRGGDRDRSFGGNDRRDRRGPGYDNRDRYGGGRDGGRDNRRGGDRGGRRDMRTRWALLVSNLDHQVTWMELKDTARQYGAVTFADANKLQKGEGIISFETKEDARDAYEKMEGRDLMGKPMKLDYEYPEEFGETKQRSRSPRKSRSRSPQQRNGRDRSGSRDNNDDDDDNRERSRSPPAQRSRSRSGSRDQEERDQDGGSRDGSRNGSRNGSRDGSPDKNDD